MRVLGMISGTSHDGIDVAVVDFDLGADGMLDGRVVHADSTAYEPALRRRLLATLPPAEAHYADLCELDTLIGQAFATAAAEAATAAGGVDLICSHGQTVYHWVEDDHARGTLQIGQPAWIAHRLGVPVVADVRVRDITSGGHGAPLVSHLDTLLLAALPGSPAALNLGGIANLTVVRPARGGEPVAFDVGPANALIDAAMFQADPSGPGYDVDGRVAASGGIDAELLGELLAEPYYRLPAPKSTGKELFNADYLARALRRRSGGGDRPELSHADVVATVTALSARVVADSVREHAIDTLVVSGGGWFNPTLRSMLTDAVPGVAVRSTDQLGAPVDAKEAIAFALIGWHTWHGLPAVVPSCTGASQASVLGAITPGAGPLRMPAPLAEAPLTLRLHGDPV